MIAACGMPIIHHLLIVDCTIAVGPEGPSIPLRSPCTISPDAFAFCILRFALCALPISHMSSVGAMPEGIVTSLAQTHSFSKLVIR
jgi:hypothetical protein